MIWPKIILKSLTLDPRKVMFRILYKSFPELCHKSTWDSDKVLPDIIWKFILKVFEKYVSDVGRTLSTLLYDFLKFSSDHSSRVILKSKTGIWKTLQKLIRILFWVLSWNSLRIIQKSRPWFNENNTWSQWYCLLGYCKILC